MEIEIPNNTHTSLFVAGKREKPAKVRQPNPLMIGNARFWATSMSVKQMEKLREWLDRAIQWRKQG